MPSRDRPDPTRSRPHSHCALSSLNRSSLRGEDRSPARQMGLDMKNSAVQRITTARYRIRPVRLALLIESGDIDGFRDAVHSLCEMWGGIFDIILPIGSDGYSEAEAQTILRVHDPDYVVDFIDAAIRLRVQPEWTLRPDHQYPLYWRQRFLEIRPFLKTLRIGDLAALLDNTNDASYSADLGLVVRGAYRPESVCLAFLRNLQIDRTAGNRQGSFTRPLERLQVVEATALGTVRRDPPIHTQTDFLLYAMPDNSGLRSLASFWNLRATGRRVVAVTVASLSGLDSQLELADQDSADRTVFPRLDTWLLLRDWFLSSEDWTELRSVLEPRGVRIDTASSGDGLPNWNWFEAWKPGTRSTSKTVVLESDQASFVGDDPPCVLDSSVHGGQYVGELRLGSNDSAIFTFPWPVPRLSNTRAPLIPQWQRTTYDGSIVFHSPGSTAASVQGLSIRDALASVLKTHGFSFDSLSSAGLAVERVLIALGGLGSCDVLRHPGVREVLRQLEGGADSLRADQILAILGKAERRWPNDSSADVRSRTNTLLDDLVARKILRSGILLQCSHCKRNGWYRLGAFDDQFTCEWCFEPQPTPRLDRFPWRYRSDGLFKLDGGAQGCIAVALTMSFLARFTDWSWGTLFVHPSFLIADDTNRQEIEVDCAALLPSFRDPAVVFAEVKTGNDFGPEDVLKLKTVALRTGAYLAFSTLAPGFTDAEIALFNTLRSHGCKLILLRRSHLELDGFRMYDYINMCCASRYSPLEGLSRQTTRRTLDQENDGIGV
jgi:hypothetical protein